MPAKLLAVARRPDGLRDKQHVDQNIPTLKLYYLTSGRQRLYQTSTKYDQTQKCHIYIYLYLAVFRLYYPYLGIFALILPCMPNSPYMNYSIVTAPLHLCENY